MSDEVSTYELRGKLSGVFSNIIDNTLSIEGAGADAKATGDAIRGVSDDLTDHESDNNNPHRVTAEQVGARPDNWTPTALEVGARPNTWVPSAEDVGATPAQESTAYPGCYYRTVNGVTEWYNPPMETNTEYRTTECYLGKAVYTAAISITALPNATYMEKSLSGIIPNSSGITQYIGSPVVLLPGRATFTGVGFDPSNNAVGVHIHAYAFAAKICIQTDYDASGTSAVVVIKYTRD